MSNRTPGSFLRPVIAFALLLLPLVTQAQDALILGVHPYQSPSKLLSAFEPLADYLSDKLKVPVKVRISSDYEAHIKHIGEDQLDVAYMGPSSYVEMVDRYGAKQILARQAINGKPLFHGAIIALESSPLVSLEDLKGKRFAFGDRASTMSHLVPRYMLHQAGIDMDMLEEYRFLGSHDNVALAVLSGDFDAGAVKEEVYQKYAHKGIKALAMTPPLSEHLFIASNRLDPQRVNELRVALLGLENAENGRAIMSSIKPDMTGMLPARDSDYDNLRDIMRELRALRVVE